MIGVRYTWAHREEIIPGFVEAMMVVGGCYKVFGQISRNKTALLSRL